MNALLFISMLFTLSAFLFILVDIVTYAFLRKCVPMRKAMHAMQALKILFMIFVFICGLYIVSCLY